MPRVCLRRVVAWATMLAALCLPLSAAGAPPVVKTVPWVASNPLIPHDTWTGKSVTLKGTSDVQGAAITYSWDFGDGSPPATGVVTNRFVIEATHAYTGTAGTVFVARLTVQNTSTGETGSREYYVEIRDKTLPVEVNVSIDQGLWYLHKVMNRWTSVSSVDYGSWYSGDSCSNGNVCAGSYSIQAVNLNAFLVNGHREDGADTNPYVETVQRGMRRLFEFLTTYYIPTQYPGGVKTYGYSLGAIEPDCTTCAPGDPAKNDYFVYVSQNQGYETGMFTDAIAASGLPTRVTTTGTVGAGANPGIRSRTYRAILQDLVDYLVAAQEYRSTCSGFGGWRYTAWYCSSDNSAAQWGAIGLLGAEGFGRGMYALTDPGIQIPGIVREASARWLTYSYQNLSATNGRFGYEAPNSYAWGEWATTPSGLVQSAMTGMGRGGTDTKWERTESRILDNFLSSSTGPYYQIRDYYYGLFAFVKAMLLHDAEPGDGTRDPIDTLHSLSGAADLDWYAADVASGAPTNGVARTLVNDQNVAGYWYGHNYSSEQYQYETAWAIIMLNRTLFEAGAPVAVANATPNPAVAGQSIALSGAASFHQDPTKSIVGWQWDLDQNGTFETNGVTTSLSFPAVGDYPVTLRVTDNGQPARTADTTVTVRVSTPPLAPTANAGGPYGFCIGRTPWRLDGRASSNPDDGGSEPGMPPDAITQYAWELNGNAQFDDAVGATPDVTTFFTSLGVGSYLITLRVTDNTAASYPSSGMGNLTDTGTAQVFVRAATDPACQSCPSDVTARPKATKVEVRWSLVGGSDHWNIYRGTASGGPYGYVGQVPAAQAMFLDQGLAPGTYFYVVRAANLAGIEACQSNQAQARVTLTR